MPLSPADLLMPGGRPIGLAGSRPGIRELPGSQDDAWRFFDDLTAGGTEVISPNYPGILRSLPDGGKIGLRPASKSGPPTIDVNISGLEIDKVKFLP